MRNSKVKMAKRALCLVFAFLFSINSFAAAVSDNDGSAFITKAEFDSLKNNFQAQIDNYNINIDNKIDSAIAGYLAGIRVERTTNLDNMLNRINNNSLDGYYSGTTWIKYGYRCMAKRFNLNTTQKPVGAILNFFLQRAIIVNNQSGTGATAIARLGLDFDSRAAFADRKRPSDSTYKNGIYYVCSKTDSGWKPNNKLSQVEYRYWIGQGYAATLTPGFEPRNENQGNAYQWSDDLNFYNDNDYWSIMQKQVSQCWGPPDDARGSQEVGIVYGPSYKTTDTNVVIPVAGVITGSSWCILEDNFSNMILDNESDKDEFDGYQSLLRHTFPWNDRKNPLVPNTMKTGLAEYGHVTIRYNHHEIEQKNMNTIYDGAVYDALNEEVTLYNGLPLFKATDKGKIKFKIVFYNESNNNVYIGLSTNKFNNDVSGYVIDSALKLRDENDKLYNTHTFESNKEYTFVVDVNKNQTVYLKTYDTSSDYGFTGATITSDIELTIGA